MRAVFASGRLASRFSGAKEISAAARLSASSTSRYRRKRDGVFDREISAVSMKSPDHSKRRRRRIIIAAVLGALIALLAIFFVNNVYDPFASEVTDLRVFLPDDLDFVVVCDDLPEFLEGLQGSEFFDSLDENQGFQDFLSSPRGQAVGAITKLRTLIEEINRVESGIELPIDVPFVGGLSGRQIVIGGYASDKAGPAGIPPMIAVIQPESNWGQVAANVLDSELLTSWFVQDQVPIQEIRHRNWGTELKIVHEGEVIEIGVARVERAILLGTDIDLLVRIVKQVRADGIPFAPAPRYSDRWAWESASDDVTLRLSLSRSHAEREIGLAQRFLRPLWGDDMASTFEELFPELNPRGSDMVSVEINQEAQMRWESDLIPRPQPSVFAQTKSYDHGALTRQMKLLVQNLPDVLFGYSWLQVSPGTLIRRVMDDPRLVDRDKRGLWYEELAANVPRFRKAAPGVGLAPNLTGELAAQFDALFQPGVSLMLFKKERSDDAIDSSPGIAVAFRVRDAAGLDDFIAEMDRALASADVQAFDRTQEGADIYWRVTNRAFLDDPINTRPGFARIGEWFVVSNWFRFLEDVPRVARGEEVGFDPDAYRELSNLVDDLELETRGLLYLDAERLNRFMKVAKEGWIEQRAEITEQEKGIELQRLAVEASRSGVLALDRDAWIDRRFQKWKVEMARQRNPDMIRQEVDRNLAFFRDVFRHMFVSMGREDDRIRLNLRLAAQ
jgi:hypothetical protein